ncbi:hypothetical protein [Spartinivicinus poritis]|uniref:Transposase TnpC homeodomain domain-containing protein n=1 Tax=Spartinivicinus poritis TaxID=2994640 RepID=A0ABT5UI24_9GAMM|nr:hypothetical protein [Spartinivicinus sp. A2-2]MDE1466044.1 hypothetical protein [Spartinivicinus sp. A2-2]
MKLPDNAPQIDQPNPSDCLEEVNGLLQEKEAIIAKKDQLIEAQQKRIAILEEYLRLERYRRLGPSSEKNTAQGELFDEAEQLVQQAEEETEGEPGTPEDKPKPKKRGGRKPL